MRLAASVRALTGNDRIAPAHDFHWPARQYRANGAGCPALPLTVALQHGPVAPWIQRGAERWLSVASGSTMLSTCGIPLAHLAHPGVHPPNSGTGLLAHGVDHLVNLMCDSVAGGQRAHLSATTAKPRPCSPARAAQWRRSAPGGWSGRIVHEWCPRCRWQCSSERCCTALTSRAEATASGQAPHIAGSIAHQPTAMFGQQRHGPSARLRVCWQRRPHYEPADSVPPPPWQWCWLIRSAPVSAGNCSAARARVSADSPTCAAPALTAPIISRRLLCMRATPQQQGRSVPPLCLQGAQSPAATRPLLHRLRGPQ